MSPQSLKIKIKENLLKIVNPTEELEIILREKLSYMVPGYQFTKKYKMGFWDGKKKLYKKQIAPIGFLEEVKTTAENLGYEIEIEDTRKEKEKIKYKWEFDGKLRNYQNKALREMKKKEMLTLSLPTGTGKTLIGLRLIYNKKLKTLILVHTKELLYQWKERIEEILKETPGVIGDGQFSEGNITISMLQTLNSRGIGALKNKYGLLIVDETHRIPATTFFEQAVKLKIKNRYGLTATPYRGDNRDLEIQAICGKIYKPAKTEKFIKDEYLAEPEFEYLSYEKDFESTDYFDEYTKLTKSENRNNAIINKARKLKEEGYLIYIDVDRIEHGEYLSEKLSTIFMNGSDHSKKRKIIINSFKEGTINPLVSTLLKEGVDIPTMNALILASPSKSRGKNIQIVGRALRPKDKKNKARIIDINDKGKYTSKHTRLRKIFFKEEYGKYYKEHGKTEGDSINKAILGVLHKENRKPEILPTYYFRGSAIGLCLRQLYISKCGLNSFPDTALGSMKVGTIIHEWLQKNLEITEPEKEIRYTYQLENKPEINFSGHIDGIHNNIPVEFKTTRSLKYIKNHPSEFHIAQLTSYLHGLKEKIGKLIYIYKGDLSTVEHMVEYDNEYFKELMAKCYVVAEKIDEVGIASSIEEVPFKKCECFICRLEKTNFDGFEEV